MPGNVIHLHVTTNLDRLDALDRRDELVDALKGKGLRVSYTDAGLDVYLSDEGVPTLMESIQKGGILK